MKTLCCSDNEVNPRNHEKHLSCDSSIKHRRNRGEMITQRVKLFCLALDQLRFNLDIPYGPQACHKQWPKKTNKQQQQYQNKKRKTLEKINEGTGRSNSWSMFKKRQESQARILKVCLHRHKKNCFPNERHFALNIHIVEFFKHTKIHWIHKEHLCFL